MVIKREVQIPNDSRDLAPKIHLWCRRTFGPVGRGWWYTGYSIRTNTYNFEFENDELATRMILTWL